MRTRELSSQQCIVGRRRVLVRSRILGHGDLERRHIELGEHLHSSRLPYEQHGDRELYMSVRICWCVDESCARPCRRQYFTGLQRAPIHACVRAHSCLCVQNTTGTSPVCQEVLVCACSAVCVLCLCMCLCVQLERRRMIALDSRAQTKVREQGTARHCQDILLCACPWCACSACVCVYACDWRRPRTRLRAPRSSVS